MHTFCRKQIKHFLVVLYGLILSAQACIAEDSEKLFVNHVAAILESKCVRCHSSTNTKGELDLSTTTGWKRGGESGELVDKSNPNDSLILDYVSGDEPLMPESGPPLTSDELRILKKWISKGAIWPKGIELGVSEIDLNWWSLKPLSQPTVPQLNTQGNNWVRTDIDRFVYQKLQENNLTPSPEADRRTLIRRLYYDIIGLPPTFKEVEEFVHSNDPQAYEKLVDQLLESPHYGERFARYWIDIVHFGETHGYDKDKPRPNAWPYRDYLIRAFNNDKPYSQFVKEQLAGDVLYPNSTEGIPATGFISAGPWDFIGHAEVPESKIDGQVARNLDRDDMVSTTMNTFVSTTVQCGRCHDHKFDPVSMEDYYSLQSIFAAVDRADQSYEPDLEIAKQRLHLQEKVKLTTDRLAELERQTVQYAGPELKVINDQIKTLKKAFPQKQTPAYGYHSQISSSPDTPKWVQLDLGKLVSFDKIVLVPSFDKHNNIGAGFGFPLRYKVEVSNDPDFKNTKQTLIDRTRSNQSNPGVQPQLFSVNKTEAQYLRITATKLASRSNDYIFSLAEVQVYCQGTATPLPVQTVTSLDSIEGPPRWQRNNLIDGKFYGAPHTLTEFNKYLQLLTDQSTLREKAIPQAHRDQVTRVKAKLDTISQELTKLPPKQKVYCGLVHTGSGNFSGRGNENGKPREIFVLDRGEVQKPLKQVAPGTLNIIENVSASFDLDDNHTEGDRRAALANWIVHRENPLTWRSIVNRVWLFHFGRGIVDSPNDFGRMGQIPTHPELLEWLAIQFRNGNQSLKELHRTILLSAVYRQSSQHRESDANIDSGNQYYWRMNRRRLDAEAIRDSVLKVSDNLNLKMYGPSFRDFVIENPEHSPHYGYELYDPTNKESFRRSVYRFLVRSQPQPFMETLDCADPSERVPKRSETLTVLQALAMLNNGFMLHQSDSLAMKVIQETKEPTQQIKLLFQHTLQRLPSESEEQLFLEYSRQHNLSNAARLLFNLNEFVFLD